ncbi:hypothetical protein GGI07_002932 [Coemansia sp. Benny D115]|nr:hypothetical protein GGI07_002932 [Coemansia sp. Benny D115]
MSSATAAQARIAYRRLLKIERKRFAGDPTVIIAAAKQTRQEFENNRAQTDEKKIKKLLKHASNVETVIKSYVVQGTRSEEKENTYQIKFTSEHALRDPVPIVISSLKKNKESKDE